jgi:hypothetical protein
MPLLLCKAGDALLVFLSTYILAIKKRQQILTLENGWMVISLIKLGNKEGKCQRTKKIFFKKEGNRFFLRGESRKM